MPKRDGRDQAQYRVGVEDLLHVMRRSIEQGMDVSRLLGELGLELQLLDDPRETVALRDCWRLLIAHQNLIQEESHLMSSRPLKKGTTRLVFSGLQHCATVREALASLAETYNVVHGGDYNFVRIHGRHLSYVVDDRQFHYVEQPASFAIEFALIRIHCVLSILAGKPLKVIRLATMRPSEPTHYHHLKLLRSQCLFNQPVYELVYAIDQADLPLIYRDEIDVTGNVYDQYLNLELGSEVQALNGDEFIQRVAATIRDIAFLTEKPEQSEVARLLNMSVATLRRKLTQADTSFRTVRDKVVGEHAINFLEDGLSPVVVAERLGYSDERSFKRAFRRWHGQTPSEYLRSRSAPGKF